MGKYVIIGDGAMGTICSIMLAENNNSVTLWSAFEAQAADMQKNRENRRFLPGHKLHDAVTVTSDDATVFKDGEVVISAVPTQFMRSVWQRLKPHYPAGTPICSVTKGIENDTLQTPTQILADVLGKAAGELAALSGPSIAPEIAAHMPATVTIASGSAALAEKVQAAITRPYFRAYTNNDIIGVELAGATKNVIAIAAGIIDGMKLGDNAKAALLARGLAEITRLGTKAGAKADTFAGLSGVGDLVTTCISPVGRNRSFGQAIGEGQTVEQALGATQSVVEGVATTKSVVALADKLGVEMPITRAIYDVLFRGVNARTAMQTLMSRPLKSEHKK